ncbi:MAG: hypothetical protein IT384_20350 [Deltaproteobacteria bacterium]|nr:hypothetical protein [Deltaproteobacteria bacterium]
MIEALRKPGSLPRSEVGAKAKEEEEGPIGLLVVPQTHPRSDWRRASQSLSRSKLLQPTLERRLPQELARSVVRDRLVPLLERVVQAQAKLRGDRARSARSRASEILREAKALDRPKLTDLVALQHAVRALSTKVDLLLGDLDYATFGALDVVGELRALNLLLSTSRALWRTIRVVDGARRPEQREALEHLFAEAEAVARRAQRGQRVDRALARLEARYAELQKGLDAHLGEDAGLDGGRQILHALTVAAECERIWVEEVRRAGDLPKEAKVDRAALWAHLREHGVPPRVITHLLRQQVTRLLLEAATADLERREEAVVRAQELAAQLAAEIEALDPKQLRSVDLLEAKTRELCARVDPIIAQLETASPLSGPLPSLRAASESLQQMRSLWTALRLGEAAMDPGVQARSILAIDRLSAVGREEGGWAPKIAKVEAELADLDRELRSRIKRDEVPLLTHALSLTRLARHVARADALAAEAAAPELHAAVAAFQDLELDPESRQQTYETALGEPLSASVLQLARAAREIDLDFTFANIGRLLNELVRVGGRKGEPSPLLAGSALAFLGDADFERAFKEADLFLEHLEEPGGAAGIERVLAIVRALAAVETEALSHIAVRIPESQRHPVLVACGRYLGGLVEAVLSSLLREASEQSGQVLASVIDRSLAATRSELDQLLRVEPAEIGTEELQRARTGVVEELIDSLWKSGAQLTSQAGSRVESEDATPDPLRATVERLNVRLWTSLEKLEMTPDGQVALRSLLNDVGASARMVSSLIQLFGAAANDRMPRPARVDAIKRSVERMGPVFVKMMQTLANIQSIISKLSGSDPVEAQDPIFEALRLLQDHVTPLPWLVIKQEIEASLGVPIDQAFVWIDPKALRSGSIGQVHRAKIRREDGTEATVVVKVRRPNVMTAFDETVRVTRLTLAMFQELLRLDVHGSIFGPVRAQAERYLPMLGSALASFVESFRIETDFPHEAENIRRFGALLGPDRYVAVPEVYPSHTRGNVLTMQEMRGFNRSRWLERHRAAEGSAGVVEQRGRVKSATDAEQRGRDWLKEALGEEALALRVTHAGLRAFRLRAQTPAGERTLELSVDGEITSRTELPTPPEEVTRDRLRHWGERAFGLTVTGVEIEAHGEDGAAPVAVSDPNGVALMRAQGAGAREAHPELSAADRGQIVTLRFDDEKQKSAQVFLREGDPTIRPLSVVPDLSERGVAALHDRLASTFANQAARGLLHGDPHEGNFFILPDGKTIGLLDFGLAIELRLHDARGPLQLVAGAVLRSPRRMAEAMLAMCSGTDQLSDAERNGAVTELAKHYAALLGGVDAEVAKTGKQGPTERAMGWLARTVTALRRSAETALFKAGLIPTTTVLQTLKSVLSMTGNLAAFEAQVPSLLSRVAGRAVKDFFLYQAVSRLFGEKLQRQKAERVERMSVLDARATYGRPAAVIPLDRARSAAARGVAR